MQPFRLDGEVALITGGATGLGFGIAQVFVESGARVVLASRREVELRKAVSALGNSASCVRHDVTQFSAAEQLIDAVTGLTGSCPTILVNNAGVHLKKKATDTTAEEFLQVLNTHVLGAHALTRAVLPGMMKRGRGSVLFISSMTALFGIPLTVAYSAAKSSYSGMVKSLATEVSGEGVRVNAIAPGWIHSDMMARALKDDPARRDRILSRTPLKRFGAPRDIGWAAVYLCSPAAEFVTGVVLPVDGGVSIGF
jgi:gluconate 5-dehydrogenase